MREILHEDGELTLALVVDDGSLMVELQSTEHGPDLSEPHEVVVVVDGQGRGIEVEGPQRATAVVHPQLEEEPEAMMLMVRVFEFFEGWELFADESD